MPQPWGRVKLTEINPHLVCVLCHGYFIDATTMAECPHSFCRSCIVLYLETKSYCPICEVQIHKTKPHLNLKPDKTLQDIVYKLVPGLFHQEMKRRREFYAKYPNRDLYLGPEARGVGVERIIYSPDDSVSLSLEYYDDEREREEWASARPGTSAEAISQQQAPSTTSDKDGLKRYLLCPANVNMGLIKKFIRLKYGLTQDCSVEVLYRRESLPDSYSLMDIAYIYTWKKNEPMRIYYRIQVPTPLRRPLQPLTPSSEPILEPTTTKMKSPELLDAVGLRPKSPRPVVVPKLNLDSVDDKKEKKNDVEEKEGNGFLAKEEKNEESIVSAEDTAVSLLLSLRSGGCLPRSPQELTPSKSKEGDQVALDPSNHPTPPASNGNTFKVPQSLTKRFVFNGGKLVAVKPKLSGPGKSAKSFGKTKVNGSSLSEEKALLRDRYNNPLGFGANGPLGIQGGKLPPGSPRPPPNSEKLFLKTKYLPTSGLAMNWPNPEVTMSQNTPKFPDSPPPKFALKPPPPSQSKSQSKLYSNTPVVNGQPVPHRKEINRLEQIVQNCKKEASQKAALVSGGKTVVEGAGTRTEGTPTESTEAGEGARAAASIALDHVAPGRVDSAESKQQEEGSNSILKRKLNDHLVNRRPEPHQNGITGDSKKKRLVTPDVSIELMAKPVKEKTHKERKREPSDLAAVTKRFLHDIQRMEMLETDMKMPKKDQICATTVKIEKVPAPTLPSVSLPRSSPGTGEKTKPIDGTDFKSDEDQLFIDIRNKCKALKRKISEPASIAIERVKDDPTTKSNQTQQSPTKSNESVHSSGTDTPPKVSGLNKKLPRLIEINAPPRPKLAGSSPDSKQKTGLKMTTVRKEVPIGKEGPQGRRDGPLDLSSGLSSPEGPKNKPPFNRPSAAEKPTAPSPLPPHLPASSSFPSHDSSRASSTLRIPSLKSKTSPTPRPPSLMSSCSSPSAEPRSNADVFPAAYQLYRHQMELHSRFLASQVNNNWSRDPQSAKKFEEWVRSTVNLPHHPLMYPAPTQLTTEALRKS